MGWLFPSDPTQRSRVPRRRASVSRPAVWSRREVLLLCRRRTRADGQWSVVIRKEGCSDCGACLRVCGESALARSEAAAEVVYTIDSRRCNGCGDCAEVCAEGALRIERLAAPQTIAESARLPVETCAGCSGRTAGLRGGFCGVCRQNEILNGGVRNDRDE